MTKQMTMNSHVADSQPLASQVTRKKFDLEERTAKFAENMIDILKKVPNNPINKRLIEQTMGAGGSLGANYCEANEAESRNDFIHKLGICKKETKEVKHWIRILAYANPEFKQEFRDLWKEAEELMLIFSAITRKAKEKKENV